MESILNGGGWVPIVAFVIFVLYVAGTKIKKYREGQKLLHTSNEAGVQKRIEDATRLARERAADWEAAFNAEKAQRKFEEERSNLLNESIKELKIRLIARADEIERLEDKTNKVTQFNLTLQAKIEELEREMKSGK